MRALGSAGVNDNGSATARACTVMATARLVWPDLTTMLKPRRAQA